MGQFINFSNHPSSLWSSEQIDASRQYGEIIDIPFPSVSPNFNEAQLKDFGKAYVEKIISMNPSCVMVQGEFTLCVFVINQLMDYGIKTVAACSERKVEESDQMKKVYFQFVKYREYVR
ncbi:MAG: hypothetical protein J6P61_01400 [Erysipelotrichaceae bacterium]|nr:hypothetical protein [Erysipelotrichaceae bacterium]